VTPIDCLRQPMLITQVGYVGVWGIGLVDLLARIDHPERLAALPSVTGFIESNFNLAVSHAVNQVKAQLPPSDGERTGFVLASAYGDVTTADVASQRLAKGRVHNPLLFYQSIPNSILGHLSRVEGFTGPMTCFSAGSLLLTHALVMAELALAEGSADRMLIVGVDLARSERIRATEEAIVARGIPLVTTAPAADTVVVLSVQADTGDPTSKGIRISSVPSRPIRSRSQQPDSMAAFLDVCMAFAGENPPEQVVLDVCEVRELHVEYQLVQVAAARNGACDVVPGGSR